MQAGESLDFITVPDELAIPEIYSEDERALVAYSFYRPIKALLSQPDTVVRSMVRHEEIGKVVVKETSLQIPFSDGSYLHLVAYGHEDEEDYLDMGLSIAEHSSEGYYLGGFSFELTGIDLQYSVHPASSSADDLDEDERKLHFSLIDQYTYRDELDMLLITGDSELRAAIQKDYDSWTEAVNLTLIDKDIGFSWRHVSPEQMSRINDLIVAGVPVPALG